MPTQPFCLSVFTSPPLYLSLSSSSSSSSSSSFWGSLSCVNTAVQRHESRKIPKESQIMVTDWSISPTRRSKEKRIGKGSTIIGEMFVNHRGRPSLRRIPIFLKDPAKTRRDPVFKCRPGILKEILKSPRISRRILDSVN